MARPKTVKDWVLYHRWSMMKQRCDPNKKDKYPYHAGKGIKVCEEWRIYANFEKWSYENGYKAELTIDRINGDGDYCPNNCRWATYKEQANNKSLTALKARENRKLSTMRKRNNRAEEQQLLLDIYRFYVRYKLHRRNKHCKSGEWSKKDMEQDIRTCYYSHEKGREFAEHFKLSSIM